MFCPNCGKDAGGSKFCPYCGTGMPELKAAVWSAGMPCPHCGGTKLEGKDCAFCGARLFMDRVDAVVDKGKCGAIPWGRYEGASGSFLELDEAGVMVRSVNKEETMIPYRQLTDVGFREQSFLRFGSLTIRGEDNAFLPIPKKYYQLLHDTTTVFYLFQDRDLYYAIYRGLKRICEGRKDRRSW